MLGKIDRTPLSLGTPKVVYEYTRVFTEDSGASFFLGYSSDTLATAYLYSIHEPGKRKAVRTEYTTKMGHYMEDFPEGLHTVRIVGLPYRRRRKTFKPNPAVQNVLVDVVPPSCPEGIDGWVCVSWDPVPKVSGYVVSLRDKNHGLRKPMQKHWVPQGQDRTYFDDLPSGEYLIDVKARRWENQL